VTAFAVFLLSFFFATRRKAVSGIGCRSPPVNLDFQKNSHCPMKKGRLLASLPAHECCPLHDDSIQKKD